MTKRLLSYCGFIFIFLSGHAFSALPPKTEEMLKEMSTLIVTGTVKEIRTKDIQEGDILKTYYYVDISIHEIEKGSIENQKTQIEVAGWVTKKAPDGWVGPSGINGLSGLKTKTEVRLFLSGNKIIEPNGLEILKASGTQIPADSKGL